MSFSTYECERCGYRPSAPRISPPSLLLADIWADIPGLPPSPPSIVQRPEADEDLPHGVRNYFPDGLSHTLLSEVRSPYPTISEVKDGSTPHLPCVSTPATCLCGCGGGPCVPQSPYHYPKDDPLEDHRIRELITFQVHGQCGMPLRDALRCKYSGLSGRDDPVFVGPRTAISILFEFHDYPAWSQQMRTKDWKRKPSPITKAKLATEVAKKAKRFLEEHRKNGSPVGFDSDRLALVALEHVSLASWQPHVRLM